MYVTTDEIFYNTEKRLTPLSFISETSEFNQLEKKDIQGLIVRLGFNVDKSVLDTLPNLKVVATITTGLNHIDIEECQKRDIKVISLKEEIEFLETIRATPELTWTLLLMLLRNTKEASESVNSGKWERERFYGQELAGKTIGIFGLGRVGKIIKNYAEAFGMNVLASDIDEREKANYVSPQELFKKADIVSIHLPLEETTQGIVNKDLLSRMKPSSVLINTARGEIINEKDLLDALEGNKISGVAVDVLSQEVDFNGDCSTSKMVQYAKANSNLLITPHIAGSTHESMQRTADFIGSKVYEFFN